MASRRLAVLPSCRKKILWPTPHNGAVRNSSGPAVPWFMPSARFVPMWCSNTSEKRFAVWLLVPPNTDGPVVRDGVWLKAQPMLLNSALPLLMDAEQFTPTVQAGVGGARKRMKWENTTTSLESFWGCVNVKLV